MSPPRNGPRKYHVTYTLAAHPEGVVQDDLAAAHLRVWAPEKVMCAADRVLVLSMVNLPELSVDGYEAVDCQIFGVDGMTGGTIPSANAFSAILFSLSGLITRPDVHPAQRAFAGRILTEYAELLEQITGAPKPGVH